MTRLTDILRAGTSAAEIQLAPPDRCIRAKCILRWVMWGIHAPACHASSMLIHTARENRKYDDEEGDEDEYVVERIVG
jgi:hypothetical protein